MFFSSSWYRTVQTLLLMLAFVGLGGFIQGVHAQASGAIAISPLIAEINVALEASYDRVIQVENLSNKAYTITFEALDVEIEPTTHKVSFLPAESLRNEARSLASWIVPQGETSFVLEPGEKTDFAYHISTPEQVSGGFDYYASLNFYFQPVEQTQLGNRAIKVRQSLGSLLLATVNQDGFGMSQADEGDVTVSGYQLRSGMSQVNVQVEVSNNTLRYIKPLPKVVITNQAGEVVYEAEVVSQRIFPGETVTVEHSFPREYLDATEELTMEYVLYDRMRETRYFEEQQQIGGKEAALDESTREVIQWGALLGVVLLGGGFIYAGWRRRKRLVKRS